MDLDLGGAGRGELGMEAKACKVSERETGDAVSRPAVERSAFEGASDRAAASHLPSEQRRDYPGAALGPRAERAPLRQAQVPVPVRAIASRHANVSKKNHLASRSASPVLQAAFSRSQRRRRRGTLLSSRSNIARCTSRGVGTDSPGRDRRRELGLRLGLLECSLLCYALLCWRWCGCWRYCYCWCCRRLGLLSTAKGWVGVGALMTAPH